MSGIVGPHRTIRSNNPPVEAHVTHLRHLTNPTVLKAHLCSVHGLSEANARVTGPKVAAHLTQALSLRDQSLEAGYSVRPILQYYSYLNLAVAVIMAYRPRGHDQTRHHGVYDITHKLGKIQLTSRIVTIAKQEAVSIGDRPIEQGFGKMSG